jgi:outer membrane protein assembly factor BamB
MVCDLARNAMLLLGLVAAAAAQDGWSMFRGSTFRDGNTREVGPSGNGTLWRFLLRDRSFAPPSVHPDGSIVYVGGKQGLYGVSRDGGFVFRVPVNEGVINSSPAVCAEREIVVFGGGDGVVYGVDARSGAVRWRVATGKPRKGSRSAPYVYSSPVLDGDVAYVGASDGLLYALDVDPAVADGARVRWTFDAVEPLWSSPALSADRALVYVGGCDNELHAVHAANGTAAWAYETGGFPDDADDPDVDSSPAVSRSDGTVYVGSFDNRLHALDGRTGFVKWTYATSDDVVSSPAVAADGSLVYVTSLDGFVHAVDAPSGRAVWKVDLGAPVYSEPALDGAGALLVGADDGRLHALDAASGAHRWAHTIGDAVRGEPAIFGGRAYVATLNDDAFLHCVGAPEPRAPTAAPAPAPTAAASGASPLSDKAWKVLAVSSVVGFGLLVLAGSLAIAVPRCLRARERRDGRALLAQHLVDDDQFADVNFIELRGREGAGPLTSI